MTYNKHLIDDLILEIQKHNGIGDKAKLTNIIADKFSLSQDRKVYYCNDFAIRFSKSESKNMSNTVLSLSKLRQYDNKPFIVCIVSSKMNHLMLANTTFLKRISHSSAQLRMDNIKGSFNGSDIINSIDNIENCPINFEKLYTIHETYSFEDNLERLVKATHEIEGRVKKFNIDNNSKEIILNSVKRTIDFMQSDYSKDLINDLHNRIEAVKEEIVNATTIDNVNLRGRVIEFLVTDNGSPLKKQLLAALDNGNPLPQFITEDKLGDFSKKYPNYYTETDIKTKLLYLNGNPKAYNIDKLLEFLAKPTSVYLIFLIGINTNGSYIARLCSVFDKRLIDSTNIIHHWAGRDSRGVAQFNGSTLSDIINNPQQHIIDEQLAQRFIEKLISQ